jgi:hypothetical protein
MPYGRRPATLTVHPVPMTPVPEMLEQQPLAIAHANASLDHEIFAQWLAIAKAWARLIVEVEARTFRST